MPLSCGASCARKAMPVTSTVYAPGWPSICAAALPSGRVLPVSQSRYGRRRHRGAPRLLTMGTEFVRGKDRSFLDALTAASPETAQAAAPPRRFQAMIKEQTVEALEPWLADAKSSPLTGFAQCLERDRAAVEAALSTPWSTGPVEGRINKLKLIKRQMYGRAGIVLLRQRVIYG